jgi:hypothetical protein
VNQNPVITLDSVINAGCNGATDGSIYISAASGLAPYTYSWSNGLLTQDLVNISAGTYSLTVVDDNICSSNLNNINVNSSSSIAATAQITMFDINGKYVLSANTSTVNGCSLNTSALSNGIYTLQITTDNGQTVRKKVVITK